MKNWKRVAALAMAATMIAGIFTACGDGKKANEPDKNASDLSENSEPADSGDASTGEEDWTQEEITLTVMTYFTQENPEAPAVAWQAMKEKFLAEHPNVTIEEETIGGTDYLNKIKTQIATGDLPDVFQAGVSVADTFMDSGYAANLNDLVSGDFGAEFNQGAINDLTMDGVTYAVPYMMVTNSNIIYNKEIFEECGITAFPETLDEFIEALQKIKDKGYIPICAGDKDNWYLDICLFREIANRYCGEDWAVSIDNNAGAKFSDPEFIQALNTLKEWYDKGFFNEDLMSLDFLQHRQYYFDGEAAMYFDGSGGIPTIVSECSEEVLNATEIATLPSLTGEKVVTGTANWGLTYNSNLEGAKKAAAEALIKTFCSPEGAKIVYENGGTSPLNVEYDESKIAPVVQKYNAMMEKTKLEKMFTNAPSIASVMDPGLQDMLMGNITPEDLAAQLDAEHQKLFE